VVRSVICLAEAPRYLKSGCGRLSTQQWVAHESFAPLLVDFGGRLVVLGLRQWFVGLELLHGGLQLDRAGGH
jgi:hypothetical protein